jgi:protocatechuate 3,4-dioxygenase alpha subunit
VAKEQHDERERGIGQTASQTVGPFFHLGMVADGENDLVSLGTHGERIGIRGTVRDGSGEPVSDALLEIWQADARGIYPHPEDPRSAEADPNFGGFGRSATDEQGAYRFNTVKPGARDGAPSINVRLFARGLLLHLVTRVYFEDEPGNDRDPVLARVEEGRRPTLVARRDPLGTGYLFDLRLQGEGETVFFDL